MGGGVIQNAYDIEIEALKDCDIVCLSWGGTDATKVWKDKSKTMTEKLKELDGVADELVELARKVIEYNHRVILIGPPIRAYSTEDLEVTLEEKIQERITEDNPIYLVRTATKMYLESQERGREEMNREWLKQNDKVHLHPARLEELIQEGLEFYNRALDTKLPEDLEKFHMENYRSNIRDLNICYKCGLGHKLNQCKAKPTCNLCGPGSKHHISVCQKMFRMCRHCGAANRHQRFPCSGWWKNREQE